MKRFLIKILLWGLPMLLIIVLVNYYGDAANLYKTDLEKSMARIIMKDLNVTNIKNFNDRMFQKEIANLKKSPPQILVMGSSRTMLIGSNFFPKKDIYNSSVSGASLEDLVAIYQIYKERKLSPYKIIIGIDPWIFNKNNEQVRWKSLADYYYRFLNRNQVNLSYVWDKYLQLISLSYFQSSVRNMPKRIFDKSGPEATTQIRNQTNTWLTDGSLTYPEKFRNTTIDQIESKIHAYKTGEIYSIENFEKISQNNWTHFKMLVEDMEKNDIEIEFLLAPYPPSVYDKLEKEYLMVHLTEEKILKLADSKNIKVYGSYNPYKLEMNIEHFYDGMHANEKGIQKILDYHNKN